MRGDVADVGERGRIRQGGALEGDHLRIVRLHDGRARPVVAVAVLAGDPHADLHQSELSLPLVKDDGSLLADAT